MQNEHGVLLKDLYRARFDEVFFAHRFLGLKLHPGQIRILRGAVGMVNVISTGNRFGKTSGIIAVRHIHRNFYKIGWPASDGVAWAKVKYRTACIAPDSRVLTLDFDIINQILDSKFVISRKGEPVVTNQCAIGWYKVGTTSPPRHFIEFRDNSAIQFYSTSEDKGSSLQGEFFGYGSYDEGGRSYHLETEIDQNLGPRFSELNAPLDIVSTPYMDSPSLAYHYSIFLKGQRGEDGYLSFEGSAYENVYLPKWYFEREEMRLRGKPVRDQVIDGKFVFAGATAFSSDDIMACVTEDLNGGRAYQKGHNYIIGSDTATSTDENVHAVLDTPLEEPTETNPLQMVRMTAAQGGSKSPDMHIYDFTLLFDHYNQGGTCSHNLECFSEGGQIFYKALPRYIQRKTKHYAWAGPAGAKVKNDGSNAFKKADLIIALKNCVAKRALRIPADNQELIQQLLMYREDDTKLKQDRVIALAAAVWMATMGRPKTPVLTTVTLTGW